MMIRKNTKEHSAIFEVLKKYETAENRKDRIKLFTIKAGESLEERKPVEESKELSDLYYSLNYNSILNNLLDKEHQLNKDGDQEDLFYFESSYSPVETPFQLSSSILNEVNGLIKDKKFKARAPKVLEEMDVKPPLKEENNVPKEKKEIRKPATKIPKPQIEKEIPPLKVHRNEQKVEEDKVENFPDSDLKQSIQFTNLDRKMSKKSSISKLDVLNYYDRISDYIIPFLKDRPLFDKGIDELLNVDNSEHPEWIKTVNIFLGEISGELILCQDKEHLLYLAENGILEFDTWLSRNKNLKNPDVLIIELITIDADFKLTVEAAKSFKEVLEICELNGFVQTNGADGLIIQVPLDGKSNFGYSKKLADLLSTLAEKKAPEIISLDASVKKKIHLNTALNVLGKTCIAPFSLHHTSLAIATPLYWEELTNDLNPQDFTFKTVEKRIEKEELDFSKILKERFNTKEIFEKLDRRYGFLLQ